MGGKNSKTSQNARVPDRYCVPHGLYSLEHVDLKKLRRLVRARKLAPLYPPSHDTFNEEVS